MNENHVLVGAVKELASAHVEMTKRIKDRVATWAIQPTAGWLYGSAARGTGDRTSDIDLLFVWPQCEFDHDEWDERQIGVLVDYVHDLSGNFVQIAQHSVDTFLALESERSPHSPPICGLMGSISSTDRVSQALQNVGLTVSGSRGPKKTRRGTAADARARLRKAREFLDAVDALERAEASADVTARKAILAAIAAADAFCCARDGNYSVSGNHNDAVDLLRSIDKALAADLAKALGHKNAAAYDTRQTSDAEAKACRRVADRLFTAAQQALQGAPS